MAKQEQQNEQPLESGWVPAVRGTSGTPNFDVVYATREDAVNAAFSAWLDNKQTRKTSVFVFSVTLSSWDAIDMEDHFCAPRTRDMLLDLLEYSGRAEAVDAQMHDEDWEQLSAEVGKVFRSWFDARKHRLPSIYSYCNYESVQVPAELVARKEESICFEDARYFAACADIEQAEDRKLFSRDKD